MAKATRSAVVRVPDFLRAEFARELSGSVSTSELMGAAVDMQIERDLAPEPPDATNGDKRVEKALAALEESKAAARRHLESDASRAEVLADGRAIHDLRLELERVRGTVRSERAAARELVYKENLPKDCLVHDLRRSAARDLRLAGVSEGEIMKLCGWKTRAMFDRYNIIDEQDLARAVAKRFPAKEAPAKESPEPNGIVTA